MNHLKNLLGGFLLLGDVTSSPRAYAKSDGGFAADAKKLSMDARVVAGEMRAHAYKVEATPYGKADPRECAERQGAKRTASASRNR